jgi:hypothetical protein
MPRAPTKPAEAAMSLEAEDHRILRELTCLSLRTYKSGGEFR